jgi:hypothetical protein
MGLIGSLHYPGEEVIARLAIALELDDKTIDRRLEEFDKAE